MTLSPTLVTHTNDVHHLEGHGGTINRTTPAPRDLGLMETLVEASRRLAAAGYSSHWSAQPGGRLVCHRTGCHYDAAELVVDEMVRFEGWSDSGDQAILYAVTDPTGGERGIYVAAYGPDASPEDAEIAQRLP